jgi:hypothetical protein
LTLDKIYFAKAVELAKRAKSASTPASKARFERMSRAFERWLNNTRNNSESIKTKANRDAANESVAENQKPKRSSSHASG